ncbi:hypothetical protein [Pseudomonas sp. SDO5271_S396]
MTLSEHLDRTQERKFIAIASALYFLMHAGILFIPFAVFWDDWVLVDTTKEATLETFSQLGSMFNLNGYLHVGLISVGVWSYKIATFFMMGASGYFLNSILRRNGAFGQHTRWCIVLLFMLLPFNIARVAIIDFPYTICYAMFFAGWLAIDRHRILAAILFFLSFNTNSLLVFYSLPILDLLYRSSSRFSIPVLLQAMLSRWELIALPFIYFFIKTTFYKPVGFYSGYNQEYNLAFVSSAIRGQIKDLFNLRIDILTTLVLLPFIYILLRKIFSLNKNQPPQIISNPILLALGMTAIIAGGFPYWILGYTPTFTDWTSRHQLLMPLGSATLICAAIMYTPQKAKIAALSLILSVGLSFGINSYASFYADWQKQLFIIEKIKNDPIIKSANFLIIEDHTKSANAINRTYRFYEWNGMLVHALGDEQRFAVEPKALKQYVSGDLDMYFDSKYKAGAHRRSSDEPVALVKLTLKSENQGSLYSRLMPEIKYNSQLITHEDVANIISQEK